MADLPHIDDMIAIREADVARMRHELEIAEAELRGIKLYRDSALRQAVQKSPLAVGIKPPQGLGAAVLAYRDQEARKKIEASHSGYRGGRQPGAISKPWRRILSELYWNSGPFNGFGQPFTIEDVINAAACEGLRLRPSEAEARLKHYSHFKYVALAAHDVGKYVVTSDAADKFGFRQGPLKDEAPDAEAQEPQESLGQGDQTGAD